MRKTRYLAVGFAVMAIACSDRPPTTPLRGPTGASRNILPSSPVDTSDLVALPSGLYHRSCVHPIPNGGSVNSAGVITTSSGEVVPHAVCVKPGPVPRGSPEIASSPWPRGPMSWTTPTINSYVEQGYAFSGTGHVFRSMGAGWTAPPKPISYSSNIVFLFPSLQNNYGQSNQSIAQPVLQLGNNGYYSPGNNWIGTLYICQGPNDPCYRGESSIAVSPGDHLTGHVSASNCSGGKCDWTIAMTNVTTNTSITGTLIAGNPFGGQTNDTYTFMHAGALEAYNIVTCDYLPAGPIAFSNFSVQNESGSVTPYFTGTASSGITPQCGFYVNSGSATSPIVLADSATTSIRALISGPGVITVGDNETWSASISSPHVGYPPYTYAWSGILSGSGSSVSGSPGSSGMLYLTVQDSQGYQYSTQQYVSVCQPGQPLPC
jgi:hypothetical protein